MQTQTQPKTFTRQVVALVVPIALQNLINVAVQSADVIMLGRLDELALSAASLAGQIQFVMMLIFFGLGSGALVLAAQYWGKGDVRTIEKVTAIALRLGFVVAVVFATLVLVMPQQLMRIFTPEADVIAEGVKYLRYIAPSYLCMGFTSLYLTIIRSVEKVVVSTIVYAVSLVTNIVLNAILIFGLLGAPAMGIAGAALATTLARILELIVVAVYAARNRALRLHWRDFFSRHKLLMKDFVHYSVPTTLNEMVWGLGISANAVIIGHMGAAAVASNSVANVTRQLATVVSFGVSSAAAIIVGRAIGAGTPDKARDYARRMLKISLIAGICGAVLIFAIRPLILWFIKLSPTAADYLSFQLLVMCLYVVAQSFTACMVVGVFRGGGDTRAGLVLDIVTMWGFSIVWGALGAFVFHWPVKVVLAIVLCDEFLKIPLVLWRYKSGRWLRNVTR